MPLRRTLAIAATLLLGAAGASGTPDTLRGVAAEYYANAARIATVTGRASAMDYYQRLLDDADLWSATPPSGLSEPSWQSLRESEAGLDLSLAMQLLRGSFMPMPAIRGLGETFVRSSGDGTMQPVAVYVPRDYSAARPAPLLVFLHGHLQAESHLLAPEFVESLADATNTIVVAPYGRGYYDFNGSESDVYDAVDAAERSFNVDVHRRYLAGYSMGAFSLFRIAPIHSTYWAALMSVSGSLLASRAAVVLGKMRGTRFYVLTGTADAVVPTAYSMATAIFLRDNGAAVTFYSQPGGTHSLYSLSSILSSAWTDMERGAVRLPIGLTGAADLPSAAGE